MQRMEQLNIRIESKLVEDIDNAVKSDPSYNSRSDYIRSVVRERVRADRKRRLDEMALKLRDLALSRGAKPGLLTHEEKQQIFEEFMREKGWA
jgi:Arc/MetJ-type ribon-helix-helix transcriptional regulator